MPRHQDLQLLLWHPPLLPPLLLLLLLLHTSLPLWAGGGDGSVWIPAHGGCGEGGRGCCHSKKEKSWQPCPETKLFAVWFLQNTKCQQAPSQALLWGGIAPMCEWRGWATKQHLAPWSPVFSDPGKGENSSWPSVSCWSDPRSKAGQRSNRLMLKTKSILPSNYPSKFSSSRHSFPFHVVFFQFTSSAGAILSCKTISFMSLHHMKLPHSHDWVLLHEWFSLYCCLWQAIGLQLSVGN